MALFDIGNVTKKLKQAGEDLTKTVTNAAEKLPEFRPEELANAVKSVVHSGQSALNSAFSGAGEDAEQKQDAAGHEPGEMAEAAKKIVLPPPEKSLSTEDALKIYYCLMSVDGQISPEEEQKYLQIGTEIDAEFIKHKDALADDCRKQIDEAADSEERYEMIHDLVSDLIRASKEKTSASTVRGKLILWNMYAIAYSDSEFSREEKQLIRYICRALQIDKSVPAEMEQTFRTLMAIDEEEKWLKTTNRPYSKVEERLNELADRKQTIMQSVYAMISD